MAHLYRASIKDCLKYIPSISCIPREADWTLMIDRTDNSRRLI